MRDPQFMARVQRVQEAASGRWLDILIDAGLPEVMLLRLNRPCPLCGGRDRFSFYRNKPDGHWFCRGCGYGDGLSLLQKWRSERFTDTLVYLERVLGLPEYKRQDTGPDSVQTAEAAAKKRRQDRIEAVWKEAQALSKVPPSDPVRLYLASRGLYCGDAGKLGRTEGRVGRHVDRMAACRSHHVVEGRNRHVLTGKRRRKARVRVHDRIDVGAAQIHARMHLPLGGRAPCAVGIAQRRRIHQRNPDQIVGRERLVRHARRRDQEALGTVGPAGARRDVPRLVHVDPAQIHPAGGFNQFGAQRRRILHHFFRPLAISRQIPRSDPSASRCRAR